MVIIFGKKVVISEINDISIDLVATLSWLEKLNITIPKTTIYFFIIKC